VLFHYSIPISYCSRDRAVRFVWRPDAVFSPLDTSLSRLLQQPAFSGTRPTNRSSIPRNSPLLWGSSCTIFTELHSTLSLLLSSPLFSSIPRNSFHFKLLLYPFYSLAPFPYLEHHFLTFTPSHTFLHLLTPSHLLTFSPSLLTSHNLQTTFSPLITCKHPLREVRDTCC
jgi:hypothetical protein